MRHFNITAKASRTGTGWAGDFLSVQVRIGDDVELVLTSRQARRMATMIEREAERCERLERGSGR